MGGLFHVVIRCTLFIPLKILSTPTYHHSHFKSTFKRHFENSFSQFQDFKCTANLTSFYQYSSSPRDFTELPKQLKPATFYLSDVVGIWMEMEWCQMQLNKCLFYLSKDRTWNLLNNRYVFTMKKHNAGFFDNPVLKQQFHRSIGKSLGVILNYD